MPNYNRAPSPSAAALSTERPTHSKGKAGGGSKLITGVLFLSIIPHQRVPRLSEEATDSWYGLERFKVSLEHLTPKVRKCSRN